jgi:hypothetical protein
MKAYFVKSPDQIELVDTSGELEEIYKLLNCEFVEHFTFPSGDIGLVDEVGAIKQLPSKFHVNGMPISGDMIVIGSKGEEFSDVKMAKAQLEEWVTE